MTDNYKARVADMAEQFRSLDCEHGYNEGPHCTDEKPCVACRMRTRVAELESLAKEAHAKAESAYARGLEHCAAEVAAAEKRVAELEAEAEDLTTAYEMARTNREAAEKRAEQAERERDAIKVQHAEWKREDETWRTEHAASEAKLRAALEGMHRYVRGNQDLRSADAVADDALGVKCPGSTCTVCHPVLAAGGGK